MDNIVIVLYLFCFMRGSSPLTCLPDITYVKFPDKSKLVALDDFDKNIADNLMGQVFLASHTPPDSNFYCLITKVNEKLYKRVCTGETGRFNEDIKELTLLSGSNTAMFTDLRDDADEITEAYWSSSPMKYIWRIQCTNYDFCLNKCPVGDTKLSVFLRFGVHIVSLNEIAEDLVNATDVEFGSGKGLIWNFFNLNDTVESIHHPAPIV